MLFSTIAATALALATSFVSASPTDQKRDTVVFVSLCRRSIHISKRTDCGSMIIHWQSSSPSSFVTCTSTTLTVCFRIMIHTWIRELILFYCAHTVDWGAFSVLSSDLRCPGRRHVDRDHAKYVRDPLFFFSLPPDRCVSLCLRSPPTLSLVQL